jgi:hypothetical protein
MTDWRQLHGVERERARIEAEPEKWRAGAAVNRARERGELTREPCLFCGDPKKTVDSGSGRRTTRGRLVSSETFARVRAVPDAGVVSITIGAGPLAVRVLMSRAEADRLSRELSIAAIELDRAAA